MTADPTAVSLEAWVEAAYQSWHKANPDGHGSRAKYTAGCRCERCNDAGTANQRRWKAKAAAALAAGTSTIPHGVGRYSNNGCRCDTCRSAKAEYQRRWRKGVKS